jgi:hypothetical protein
VSNADKEGDVVTHQEIIGDLTSEDRDFLANFTEAQKRNVMWKVDYFINPSLRKIKLTAVM